MVDYFYQTEKLSAARRALMLPHSQGDAASISDCFHECSLAFHQFDDSILDDNARNWVGQIKELMSTEGIEPPANGAGLWHAKARNFTTDQKIALSRAVDELAHWLDSHRD